MLAAAVEDAWSTYLYWLPCRGSMLDGTIIHPTVGDGPSYEDFEKLDPAVKARMFACERRMDGDISEQWPWTSELGVAVMRPPGGLAHARARAAVAAEDRGCCVSSRSSWR